MIDIRLFTSIFSAIVAAGLVLIALVALLPVFDSSPGLQGGGDRANEPAVAGNLSDANIQALEDATQRVAELEQQQADHLARIALLEEQRFNIERARLRREREANFERWYASNMPEDCREPPFGDLNVECINDKIRAKRNYMASKD